MLALGSLTGVFAQTTVFQENFESGLPGTWSQTTSATDGGWLGGTSAALSSSAFTIPTHTKIVGSNDDACDCDKSADRLITPAIDLSGVSTAIVKFDLFYFDGAYQGAQEEGYFEYSLDGGSNWTQLEQLSGAGEWQDGILIDASAAAGNNSVMFSWLYNDGGGWTFGMALDNVVIFEPAAVDVELTSLSIPPIVAAGNIPVTGTITSYGTSTLNDVTITWTDGTNNYTDMLTGLGLGFGDSYNFSHADALVGVGGNTYNLDVTADASGDAVASNNSQSATVVVATQSVPRITLVEEFTSSTCVPCANFNVNFDPTLESLNTNQPGSNVAAVKYQMDWPSPGNDPSFNPEGDARRGYYGVTGIPSPWLDGAEMQSGSAAELSGAADKSSFVSMCLEVTRNGLDVSVTATATPYANFSGTHKLHIAAVEEYYDYAASTTTQDAFHFAQRKMLPGSSGTTVQMNAGTPATASGSHTFVETPSGNPTQGSFDLWESMDDVIIVAFVQNNSTKEVLQSIFLKVPASGTANICQIAGVNDVDANVASFMLYPNPTANNTTMRLELSQNDHGSVQILNMQGAMVYSQALGSLSAGVNNITLNTDNLSSGLYFVNVELENGRVVERLSVVK